MKMVVEFTPDDDGKRCGECDGPFPRLADACGMALGCEQSFWDCINPGDKGDHFRGPACLSAQAEYELMHELAQSANDCSKCGAINKNRVQVLVAALEKILAMDKRSVYERCPDCEQSNNECTSVKTCKVCPTSQIGDVAKAALADLEKER